MVARLVYHFAMIVFADAKENALMVGSWTEPKILLLVYVLLLSMNSINGNLYYCCLHIFQRVSVKDVCCPFV